LQGFFKSSLDKTIRIFDIRLSKVTQDWIEAPVISLDLTRDGRCLLVGTSRSALGLYDLKNGLFLTDYDGPVAHNHFIQARLSSTNKYVVSGSEDARVYVFDIAKVHLEEETNSDNEAVPISCSLRRFPNIFAKCGFGRFIWKHLFLGCEHFKLKAILTSAK